MSSHPPPLNLAGEWVNPPLEVADAHPCITAGTTLPVCKRFSPFPRVDFVVAVFARDHDGEMNLSVHHPHGHLPLAARSVALEVPDARFCLFLPWGGVGRHGREVLGNLGFALCVRDARGNAEKDEDGKKTKTRDHAHGVLLG